VLTAEQVAVLRLYADGHTYRTSGEQLGISENAAKHRCQHAARALGTRHITHTVAEALRRGLLEEEPPMPTNEQIIQAAELVVGAQFGSASFLQRRLGVKFAESHRILDRLHELGVVGPADGARARDVLITPGELDDLLAELRKVKA
jgi:DNA-binding CsgD family transcriptional regulator